MPSWCVVAALLATGCASSVTPPRDAGAASDGGACESVLTCFVPSVRATVSLPSPKACGSDGDCVVRVFPSNSAGTLEIVGLNRSGVAAFDTAAHGCAGSAGLPSDATYFEDDGGTVEWGPADAGAAAVCRAGCCVAVRWDE